MVGQYRRIRRRYDSKEILGIFLAWNVRADAGAERAVREADIKVFHIGECSADDGRGNADSSAVFSSIDGEERLSFAVAI